MVPPSWYSTQALCRYEPNELHISRVCVCVCVCAYVCVCDCFVCGRVCVHTPTHPPTHPPTHTHTHTHPPTHTHPDAPQEVHLNRTFVTNRSSDPSTAITTASLAEPEATARSRASIETGAFLELGDE